MMNSETVSLLIILQTYSKKIDTSGFEIVIIIFLVILWYVISGGQKKKNENVIKKPISLNLKPEIQKTILPNKTNNISEKYPQMILDKLSNKEFMEKLIEGCYETKLIDLKKYHKEFSFSEYYNGKLDDLDSLKINKNTFGNYTLNEFWFIKYNNLNYLFNGEVIFPCSGIMKRESDILFSIFYIPTELDIKLSNSLYFEVTFYDKISKKIKSVELLNEFLLKLNNYIIGFMDEYNIIGYNMRFVLQNDLTFKNKVTLLDSLNSLEFFNRLYFTKIGYIPLHVDKLINSFYNYNTKDSKDIVKITKTSTEILKQDEILKILVEKFQSVDDILDFFNYSKLEEYISESGLKNNFENNSSLLSTSFFYHNYVYNIHHSNRNYNDEKIITDQLRKFKIGYYRSITPKLREIESEIRVSRGFNVVGTFTNESLLFNKIKETFIEYKVISQGSPSWLGRQRIDIYFPDLNIGIEYHGDQHFHPIPFFGGEEGLIQRKILDSRKIKLCLENDCKLYCVDKNYSFEDLKVEIELEIEKRIKNLKEKV